MRAVLLAAMLATLAGYAAPSVAHAAPAACLRTARTLQIVSKQRLAGADVQGPPLVDAARGHVFLTDAGAGQVLMFDACTGALLHTTALGPVLHGSALDARLGRFFVAMTSRAPDYAVTAVAMLDTGTAAVFRTIPVPRTTQGIYQPHAVEVAFDERTGRAFVLDNPAAVDPTAVPHAPTGRPGR